MRHFKKGYLIYFFMFVAAILIFQSCSKDDKVYEQTRLFRPVLNSELKSKLNTIIVDLAKIKQAVSYTIEISLDSFKTAPIYKFTTEKNNLVIDDTVLGEELAYNTLYQVRVTGNAADQQYNSRDAFVGSVRTERLPSIMLLPRAFDVTDVKARIRWEPAGEPVDEIRTFAATDITLKNRLASFPVSAAQNTAGEIIIQSLTPATKYIVAIYSNKKLRGFLEYSTLVKGVYPGDPNVIDLTQNEDPAALTSIFSTATNGSIILLKKGTRYNIPATLLGTSITIKGVYDLTEAKAELYSTSDMKIAAGVSIDLTFDDIKIVGSDPGAVYVLNLNNSGTATNINTLLFKNCILTSMRGIARIRADCFIKNFIVDNCIVYNIGNYGIFTTDTDGANKAAIDNIKLLNSTFYQMTIGFTSRQNSKTFIIDACTFSEFSETGQSTFRYRGPAGSNQISDGLTISNTIWGTGWDRASSGNKSIAFLLAGLASTNISVTNTWATSDFAPSGTTAMPGLPSLTYNGPASKLWVDLAKGDFNFADTGFGGKGSSGDPRWRVK